MGQDNEDYRPDRPVSSFSLVPKEEAEAAKAIADFGATTVAEVSQLSVYMARIVGTVPEDLVGLVIGDPLHFVRTAIAGWYDQKLSQIQQRRQSKAQPVSPSVAIPLLRAAYDESRPELQELWAALIAAATDPERSNRVRVSFIDTLKQFDPLDAVVFRDMALNKWGQLPDAPQFFSNQLQVSRDEAGVSFDNLEKLGCMRANRITGIYDLTPYGRLLFRALSD